MKYQDLNSDIVKNEKENAGLRFLYNTFLGRFFLKILTLKTISKFVGIILNSSLSKPLIKKYIKKYDIKVDNNKKFKSFNDFFKRKQEIEKKYLDDNSFIATAESKISCYKITDDLIFEVKNSKYTVEELLKTSQYNEKYKGGLCIIYRLEPSNYHRYIFIDDGEQTKNNVIKGKLHTVNPIVYDKYKVFSENTRECSILHTKNFGDILQIEVGALCVGKIKNHTNCNEFKRYDEKGYFEFGGSTIIQLIEKDKVTINSKIYENTKEEIETKVNIGQIIGTKGAI